VKQPIDEIWNEVVQGDHDAWQAVLRIYAPLVHTVARRIGLSDIDTEDCAQHTWMALYRNRRTIRDPARLPYWLIQTTRRQAMRMSQRSARDSLLQPYPEPSAAVDLPDEEILRLERQAILEAGLSRLSAQCSRLLRALFLSPENRSYRDIAKDLGLSPNTMGPLRSRCLKKLRRILDDMGFCRD
jgi:RNA polymerase sigma factor (sigma-70 family)